MPAEQTTQLPSTKRPYATPTLVVHGDVQTLTQGKNGTTLDQDSTGSFIP